MSTPFDRFLEAAKNFGLVPKLAGKEWKCRCPAHDDTNPSLSVMQTGDGTVLVHCFAGCETVEVCRKLGLQLCDLFPQTARRMPRAGKAKAKAPPPDRAAKADKPVFPSLADAKAELERWMKQPAQNYWVYPDPHGEVSMLVFRFPKGAASTEPGQKPDKTFRPIGRVTGGWVIGDPEGPLPLYGLPRLLALKPGSRVYVVEGEKTADAAVSIGLVGTTSCHGADGWSKSDWSALKDLDVVLLPDRDDAGEKYAAHVAHEALRKGARSARIVKLWDAFPDLPKGGDLADLVQTGTGGQGGQGGRSPFLHVASEVARLADMAIPLSKEPGLNPEHGGEQHEEAASVADRLVTMAMEHFTLVRSKGAAFAIANHGGNLAMMLDQTGPVRERLARMFHRKYGKVPSGTAMNDAMTVLRGAALDQPHTPVYLRVARDGEGVSIDLGDPSGRTVHVAPAGWRIQDRSPATFKRTSLGEELPLPEAGGSLDAIREFMNVTDECWPLLLGWMEAALIENIAHPILFIGGVHGSGKSTLAKHVAGLIDPSTATLRSLPRDLESLAISVSNTWFTVFDNVSDIPTWLSDALCRIVTGDALVTRKLYSNTEPSAMSYRRPIGITAIDAGALRGDLADRSLMLDLAPMNGKQRRSDSALDEHYRKSRPRLVGALLDLLSKILQVLPAIRVDELPRMGDFGRVLAAMDACLGTDALERYKAQFGRVAVAVVESDAVGAAIMELLGNGGEWSGNASRLCDDLRKCGLDAREAKNPRQLASILRKLEPSMRAVGIEVIIPDGSNHKRVYFLRATAQTAQPPTRNAPDQSGLVQHIREVGRSASGGEIDRPTTASGEEVAS